MKKSKVILPAMALLLFSTAASVTGTVAWFSATRVFNTSAAQFGINTIDGNLKAAITAHVGTEAVDANGQPTNTPANAVGVRAFKDDTNKIRSRLYHGSVDWAANSPVGWTLNRDAKADGSDRYLSKGTEADATTAYASNHAVGGWFLRQTTEPVNNVDHTFNYYVAFSWNIALTYEFGSGEQKVGIFLDRKESYFSEPTVISSASQGVELKTATGLRIALIPTDGVSGSNHRRVFANSGNYARGYINTEHSSGYSVPAEQEGGDPTVYSQGTYSSQPAQDNGNGNYLVHTDASNRISSDTIAISAAHGHSEHLADIVPVSQTTAGTLNILCVAWYEGEDPGVVSTAEMDEITTNLTFYSRQIVADPVEEP